jgi:hypothetical protein
VISHIVKVGDAEVVISFRNKRQSTNKEFSGYAYDVFVGEMMTGFVAPGEDGSTWTAFSVAGMQDRKLHPLGYVRGFATRLDAAMYIIHHRVYVKTTEK